MKFVLADATTVLDSAADQHLFKLVVFEEAEKELCKTLQVLQPDAGWDAVGGEKCIAYGDAVKWACAFASGAPDIAQVKALLKRPGAEWIGRCLAAAVGHAPVAVKAVTPSVLVEQFKVAWAKIDAAARAGLVLTAADLIDLAAAAEGVSTSEDGVDEHKYPTGHPSAGQPIPG